MNLITLGSQRVKPGPNGPPNSSQLEPSSQLRWSWVSFGRPLGLSWLELAWIWSSSNFRPTRAKFSTVWPPQPTCFVIVRWLRGRIEYFSCKLARLGGTVWPPADASFDFVTWLELAWVGSTVWPGLYSDDDKLTFIEASLRPILRPYSHTLIHTLTPPGNKKLHDDELTFTEARLRPILRPYSHTPTHTLTPPGNKTLHGDKLTFIEASVVEVLSEEFQAYDCVDNDTKNDQHRDLHQRDHRSHYRLHHNLETCGKSQHCFGTLKWFGS